jgi:hypothetical protein
MDVNFRYYERRARKIDKNLPLFLMLLSNFEKNVGIFSNFVSFSQYLNFNMEPGFLSSIKIMLQSITLAEIPGSFFLFWGKRILTNWPILHE